MNNTIFVLEDMIARIPIFQRVAKELNMELCHVETVSAGKAIFLKINPEVVFLDHDLGGQTFVDSEEEETGVQMARWIRENDKDFRERNFIVHSANPGGAENIKNELEGYAYVIPVSQFVRRSDILKITGSPFVDKKE